MGCRKEYVEIENCEVAGSTDKAARIVDKDGESHWIPWSCIEECCELQMRGDCGTLIVEKWLARKENMI